MRIALISDFTGWGWAGCEELWADLARRALQQGNEAAFVQSRDSVDEKKLKPLRELGLKLLAPGAGTELAGIVKRRVSWRLGSLAAGWWSPFGNIPPYAPDVLFITLGNALPSLPFIHDLERAGVLAIPYVIVCHNSSLFDTPIQREDQEIIAKFYSGARRVLFVAQRTYKDTEHLLATGLPRVSIVRNPVNMIDAGALPMPNGPTARIATLGRLTMRSKGQDVLLAALGSPQFKGADWILSIYGDGPHLENLKKLAKHYGIADRVAFKGHQSDVRAIWAENHLLAMSSRNESAPLVIVEAMLCGRPCVVNDVGGISEWVSEPETGFISSGIHVESFVAALDRAWAHRNQWTAIGERARERALQLIDPDPGGTALKILHEVVSEC